MPETKIIEKVNFQKVINPSKKLSIHQKSDDDDRKTIDGANVWPALNLMPQKRRNCGRAKMNSGRKQTVNCLNCGRMVPRDKAIKRFMTKNMVDSSSAKDVMDASIYTKYELPKAYQKCFYCVSCACHRRIVRVRSRVVRRVRVPLFLKLQRERAEQRQNQQKTE